MFSAFLFRKPCPEDHDAGWIERMREAPMESLVSECERQQRLHEVNGATSSSMWKEGFTPSTQVALFKGPRWRYPIAGRPQADNDPTIEGPQFSTRAESNLYRSWGGTVINMSTLPEAKLAAEAEIAYQVILMSTDYDVR